MTITSKKPTNVIIREIVEMVMPLVSKEITGIKRVILDKEMKHLMDSLNRMSPAQELEAYELLLQLRNKLNKEME